jgi:Domain of unknown function (DUF4157)
MSVQLKELKKTSRQTPTAGPSADDRVGFTPGDKPIEGRLQNIVGSTGSRSRIMVAGGSSQGVRVGMTGYIKEGVDGVLATFEIEAVEANRSYAWVDVDPTKLRANAFIVINTAPPKSKVGGKPHILAHHQAGTTVEIIISHGADQGLFQGMQGKLVAADGKSRSFTITKVDARKSYVYFENTTVDELRGYTSVELARPSAPVQRRANGGAAAADVQSTAQAGVAGASSPLPFLDVIQRSFGKHDVSGVRAQIGGPAADASHALGARAYATGNTVAFASAPDLHTAAHEAAHTVQQSRGAVGFQGLGAADDEHERNADAVADAVVAGRSAEALLEVGTGSAKMAVQRKKDSGLVDAVERSPFAKPMRAVFDWRKHVQPRAMPEAPEALDCAFDAEPNRAGVHEHPSKPVHQSPTHTEDDLAWPAIRDVSTSVKSTHDDLVAEVSTYKNAHKDPTLKSLLYAQPEQAGSLAAVTNRQRSPERDGIQIGSLFDEEGQLALEPSTRDAIGDLTRPRAETGRAAAGTVEKSAALHAAVHMLRAAFEGLHAARADVDDIAHQIAMQRATNQADDVRREVLRLQDEASEFKAAFDAAFAILSGLAHVAAGEVGDAISKIGELAGTLLSRMNHRSIAQLEVTLVVSERTIKNEKLKSLAAMLDARKARVRQSTHQLDSAKSAIATATAARSAAYKSLGSAAASELNVPEEEKRKVSAMIAALPMIELVAARARSIANTPRPPAYNDTAGHGLWLAVASGDRHVAAFLRAHGEISGARELYGRVASHWERRLAQVRTVANGVGSHASE